ncbi:MAG: mechanosensitive ion channel [Hydrogenophaga sp.]|uniref:mechanosensitive ion channel family protein n=1 Tax=Hydrogenophaga sp. TaxID=1904254 RepID=UPI0016AC1CEF|nr:mechanosensitive ion channel domain-containing protein [Hydrogenophaga sp.]NIM41113.1 mechanosensitive ion channel [Hydrogenophaga sp.]NIN26429.1 mechanosensitive ion channel [Hydrogenophaga sp.]NIN31304.1 mechanosensitive ion channel [Hydrogenophaga sp.]NIN55359.1 mechanosensitive ion channel [Hydrogenophaga sp.]NIO51694.1 mechanosensitive ion channel [Hydrogenophaga sp.]
MSAENLWWTLGRGLDALDVVLFRLGDAQMTLALLLKLLLLLALVFWAAGAVRRWLLGAGLSRFDIDTGTRYAVAATARYLLLVLGVLMVLQNVGINLAALSVVAGAVGLGVGFGLQNVVSNFISGLIIMFERPIKVGDRVEVASVEGVVREISARRTTVVTSDNVAILIPNQRFILDNVVNLAYLDGPVRLRVAVGLPSGADAALVGQLLREAAHELPEVLREPAPQVLLRSLGGASQQFELAVWFQPQLTARDQLASALNLAVARRLEQAGVKPA